MTSPTLLVSRKQVLANLRSMSDRARRHGLAFRPHFKTHQSQEVAGWIKEMGVREISVTSLRMAYEYADGGWDGITIAMPLNIRELPALNQLAERVNLSVFVNHDLAARELVNSGHPNIRCFTELDAGYGRSGVDYQDHKTLTNLVSLLGTTRFRGYYVHSGHTYDTASTTAIGKIHQQLLAVIAQVKNLSSTPVGCEFAIGDTPACSIQEDFRGVTSIGPGNFVYYDLVQSTLGACQKEDIAVCLLAPVLEVKKDGKQLLLHAGWVQLGKDQLSDGTYGQVVQLNDDLSWDANKIVGTVIKLSQEHGTAVLTSTPLLEVKPGELLGVLPVHACATVHGMRALDSISFVQ